MVKLRSNVPFMANAGVAVCTNGVESSVSIIRRSTQATTKLLRGALFRILVPVSAVGCGEYDPEDEDMDEHVADVQQDFSALTSVQSYACPNCCFRGLQAPFAETSAVAAAWSLGVQTRFVVLWNYNNDPYGQHCATPHNLQMMLIDGNPASGTYGKRIGNPINAMCNGSPCQGHYPDGTSWRYTPTQRLAVFAYAPYPAYSLRALRVSASGGHAEDVVVNCNVFSPTCRITATSIASSERNDGTDQMLIGYLRGHPTNDDWVLNAILYKPFTAPVTLTTTVPCAAAPCAMGVNPGDTAIAYNKLEDKFLIVSGIGGNSPNPRIVGRIFTAAGVAGPTIDFGVPTAGPESWRLGVASNPDPNLNPAHEWVVTYDGSTGPVRVQVMPNGSFVTGSFTPSPVPVNGSWTLNWTKAPSDSFAYERLVDESSGQLVRSARHPGSFGTGAEYSLDAAGAQGFNYVEDLAHDHTSDRSLALWSGWNCSFGCGPWMRWRLIDQ